MSGFNQRIQTRVRDETLDLIEDIIAEDNFETYQNVAHFLRCAVLEKIRKLEGHE
jgi:hypothetical protein